MGVGVWIGSASSADDTPADRRGDGPGVRRERIPATTRRAELRGDLKAARELEGTERRDALKGIREDAREGKYGDRIERQADRRGDHRAAFFALLPDELQADLKKAREIDDADDRKAALDDIRKKALAGDYGDKVKEAFKLLGEHRQARVTGRPPERRHLGPERDERLHAAASLGAGRQRSAHLLGPLAHRRHADAGSPRARAAPVVLHGEAQVVAADTELDGRAWSPPHAGRRS